jgi:hypothetical protein
VHPPAFLQRFRFQVTFTPYPHNDGGLNPLTCYVYVPGCDWPGYHHPDASGDSWSTE